MATIASTSSANRNSLIRSLVIGGMIITVIELVLLWIIATILGKIPFIITLQYIASGVLDDAAFEGGITTAVIGLIFHVIISFTIAGVFILSAERIAFLRRYPIATGLLYGFGVWFVMNLIVVPLSATPPVDAPTTPQIIESIVEHILVIGLTVGMLVKRNANPIQ